MQGAASCPSVFDFTQDAVLANHLHGLWRLPSEDVDNGMLRGPLR
jgi:hypothetical protein